MLDDKYRIIHVIALQDIIDAKERRNTIFDYLDMQILRRIIVRKSCEIAAATFDQSLSETERSIKVRILAGQINYARCIAKIGGNDLTEFEEMMDTVTEGCPPMPTEMFSAYLDRLDRDDM